MTPHPKGSGARILLSSVFGPYAQDDQYGSRKINPMELYHNQVTREQGPFSLRMFHRSWGILMIQQNISAPTTVLDFPTREAFEAELLANEYDIVGISSIIVNVGKVREMCRIVRRVSPRSDDRHRRARHRDPRHRAHDRRRPHRARRRDRVDARLPGRGRDGADPASARSSRASTRARSGSSCRSPRAPRPRPSFRRWAARWDATSAPRRRSSAARESTSTSTTPATSCST